ncbi:rhamnulokinase [Ruania halotolerans]|uniref:rhamnulokinase n=1 Tax=Ruania halotolerans TaxID=2897773 RepID=UPI001E457717|nr:rhamnulokinase family protein [Ruania halotolerans]UFU05884.1 rhamnulokinase [Ruania halotolerans]
MGEQVAAFAAVDLGATSGRVIRAEVDPSGADGVRLREVVRFANAAEADDGGTLRWDLSSLFEQVLQGLQTAGEAGPLLGIGIDTWAVDYGLLDAAGQLLAEPVAYRDSRTEQVIEQVHAAVPPDELYGVSGMQHLPFNTIYQLAAERRGQLWDRADQALLLPDLLAYWLTGQRVSELTNASSTALLDQRSRAWSQVLMDRLGIPADLFPPVVEPGTQIGVLTAEIRERTGLGAVPVYAVGSHDTASAVASVPAEGSDFAYISSGTWSLVGVELDAPVLTEESRAANFTNELGVDGTVRYLRNVMGLWVLSESQRVWAERGQQIGIEQLLTGAAHVPARRTVLNVDHPDFLPPGDMPARLAAHARSTGQPEPVTPGEVARCVIDSLAVAYRRAIADATSLSGKPVRVVHIVGGGSRNALLCQAAADAIGLPVIAGPEEGTALGNVLVQARAARVLGGDLSALRRVGARGLELRHYEPDLSEYQAWAAVGSAFG